MKNFYTFFNDEAIKTKLKKQIALQKEWESRLDPEMRGVIVRLFFIICVVLLFVFPGWDGRHSGGSSSGSWWGSSSWWGFSGGGGRSWGGGAGD